MIEIVLKDGTRDVWDGSVVARNDRGFTVALGGKPAVHYEWEQVDSITTGRGGANNMYGG